MPTSKVFNFGSALLAAALLITAPALAQNAEEKNKTEEVKASKKKFERVEVTGSLIRRSDFEGPSPVQVIDRQSLDESSYNSVADYVRDLPISSFGSARESSGSATSSGTSTINLRGLGSSNTLVLLNGSRLPADGTTGAVNMNTIPEIIIDGVDILKDGASATYGSDAIGGVVAIKSRKNFTGLEGSFQSVVTEESGGARNTVGLLYGKQFGKLGPFTGGSVTLATQYRQNEKIFDRDRSWSQADAQGIKGWSSTSPVPTYKDSAGDIRFLPAQCAAQNGFVEDDGDNSYCRYAFADRSASLPEIKQGSMYLNAELEMGTRDRISLTALASRAVDEWEFAPSPGGFFLNPNLMIPGSLAGTINNGGPLPGTTGSDPVSFAYRTAALGDRLTSTSNDSYYIQAEYAHEFGDTWEWKSSAAYSSNSQNGKSLNGYALTAPFLQSIADGNFNPFDQNDDGSGLEAARYSPFQKTSASSVVVDSRVNGELFSFGANGQNVLSAAFGTQYIHSEYSTTADQNTLEGLVFGNAGSEGFGQRDVMAAYTELGLNLGRMVEIQAAARFDRFSDFGEAFSPKLGVKFKPLKSLMFRASVGKAFKAPLLDNLYGSVGIGFPAFIDHVKCEADKAAGRTDSPACRNEQYPVESGGNPDLQEERATSYNVGFIFEPIKGLAIGSDYWAIEQTNLVGLDLEEMTKAELAGVDLSVPNPTGVLVEREADDTIKKVTAPNLNLSSRTQSGLDFNISYNFKTRFGRIMLSDAHSQTFEVLQAGFIGVPKRDYLDDYGTPKWRNTASLTYSPNRSNAITLSYMSLAGYKNIARDGGRIPSYGELEVSYTTQLPWWKGTTLTAGIRNLEGKTPPIDENGGSNPFLPGLYSQLQRHGYLNLRHSF